jgi:heme/copper-type cytochrome/quinol oxidase subunit 2
MKCLITVVLMLAGASPAYADIPVNRVGDNTMLLIIGIVVVVISVSLWKMIQSRKK